jgi:anaerobic magnesium-protoporphyrin IX monomethyl ester cyclase
LLINPTITSRSSARFPLSLLHLAAALDQSGNSHDHRWQRRSRSHRRRAARDGTERFDAVGISVMGGPQIAPSIEVSKAIRERYPAMPIIWGGYFPTLYTDTALAAPYVDYAIRGQGEESLPELIAALTGDGSDPKRWRRSAACRGNATAPSCTTRIAVSRWAIVGWCCPTTSSAIRGAIWRVPFSVAAPAAHQASIGCRFRCTFCGVNAMFGGTTVLPPRAARARPALSQVRARRRFRPVLRPQFLRPRSGHDSAARSDGETRMPWWCYARSDALLNLSESTWKLVRKSRLRMAYIGAESPSGQMLKEIRKGTRPDQTLEVAELCRRNGVIPETLLHGGAAGEHRRRNRAHLRVHPRVEADQSGVGNHRLHLHAAAGKQQARKGSRQAARCRCSTSTASRWFSETPEEWMEPRWVDYACHADAPWLTDKLRRRIHDFVTVLRCRFPTVQDCVAAWAKRSLSAMASWRYRHRSYDRPWELNLANRLVRLRMPQVSGL